MLPLLLPSSLLLRLLLLLPLLPRLLPMLLLLVKSMTAALTEGPASSVSRKALWLGGMCALMSVRYRCSLQQDNDTQGKVNISLEGTAHGAHTLMLRIAV
jgi:hypothetical protein